MPNCFVPGCRSGSAQLQTKRKYFKPPKNKEAFRKWEKAIQKKGKNLSFKSYICDAHFPDRFIIKADKFIIDGKNVELPRKNWRLKPDAVPLILRSDSEKNEPCSSEIAVIKEEESSVKPVEVNIDDETDESNDMAFSEAELCAEDPLSIETNLTPETTQTQSTQSPTIQVRTNLKESSTKQSAVVNAPKKRSVTISVKRPLPSSDSLDSHNALVSIEDEYKNYIDEDKAFLMSLLPSMKELTGPQKMEFKMTVLNELKRIRYPTSTPPTQTVVLPYTIQQLQNIPNLSHLIPMMDSNAIKQVINKNNPTLQQTCKILTSQPPPLTAIIPQTIQATSIDTKQKQNPIVTTTTTKTITTSNTKTNEPPAKRAAGTKENPPLQVQTQVSTENTKPQSKKNSAKRKKILRTNPVQEEEIQMKTNKVITTASEEITTSEELHSEINIDDIKIEYIKVEPYTDEHTEGSMDT